MSVFACSRHMQQPIYWPDKVPSDPNTYQKAYDSLQLKGSQGGHPKDDMDDIFGKGLLQQPSVDCFKIAW